MPPLWTGPDNRDLDFMGKSISVASVGGPESCIIDCEDLGRGFHFHNGEDQDAIVHGFTIRNGHTIDSSGAGILINGAAPVISNCVLTGNDAEYPRDGGGIFASGGLIIDCIIRDNRADFGGGLSVSGDTVVQNCLIMNNFADEAGGGLFTGLEGNPLAYGCTITENGSGEGGGGVFVMSSMEMINTIVWDNWAAVQGAEGYLMGYGPSPVFSFSYCDLGGDWYMEYYSIPDPGPGNIYEDPLFATGPNGSWYLSQTTAGQPTDSPCVDAGDPASALFGTTRTDLQCVGAFRHHAHRPPAGCGCAGYGLPLRPLSRDVHLPRPGCFLLLPRPR